MNDLDQFKQTYLTECDELLTTMEELLLEMDCEAVDLEQLGAIFRCAHSIKGGSGAFGLVYITNFTHVLEALLDSMREGKVMPTREVVDVLLKAVDIVKKLLEAANNNTSPPEGLGSDIRAELEKHAKGSGAEAAAPAPAAYGLFDAEEPTDSADTVEQAFEVNFAPHPTLFETGNDPLLILRELCRLGNAEVTAFTHRIPMLSEINPTHCYLGWLIHLHTTKSEADIREAFEFVEDHCDIAITKQVPPPSAEAAPDAVYEEHGEGKDTKAATNPAEEHKKASSATTSIRVDIEKVDKLVNMIGELVITEAMLRAQTRGIVVEEFAGLLHGIDELSQHTRALQEAVMSVRMQAVKSIFSRMPRIVRDLSAQLKKEIRLETKGEATEVDKTVIEQLGDPLMHMIRNSVDHGIESPEERIKNGKPAQGTICLTALHRGGRILIEIEDDGAGINRPKVLAKAKEKGLIAPDAVLSDEECDQLIFLAGFSTAEKVTNVSGRGVGMDVVKRNIEGLGGTVRIHNNPGKGAGVTLSLPLTLAILDGMIVRVGKENFIIPITNIIESMRPKAEQVRSVEGHSDVINIRGEFVSIVYLHDIFGITDAEHDPSKALVVLVETRNATMGLVVDELIGQQQVVIKSLEENADPVKGISGATILGDGRVSLILETNELQALCTPLSLPSNNSAAAMATPAMAGEDPLVV